MQMVTWLIFYILTPKVETKTQIVVNSQGTRNFTTETNKDRKAWLSYVDMLRNAMQKTIIKMYRLMKNIYWFYCIRLT